LILSVGLWLRSRFLHKGRLSAARAAVVVGAIGAVFFLGATLVSPDTTNTDRDLAIPIVGKTVEPSVRVLIWSGALQTWASSPIFGTGTGTDPVDIRYETLSGQNQRLRDAHNVWLSILAQSGIVGFATFLALTIFVLKRCRFKPSEAPEDEILIALSCAFAGALLYQGLTGAFEDARHIWVLIGMIAGVSASDMAAQRATNPTLETGNDTLSASK
jgi:O-antigen ligase